MLFNGCVIYIIPKCIGPKRYQLFKNQVLKNGGTICKKQQCDSSISHVVYDEGLSSDDPEIKHFLTLEKPVIIVGTKWLSECIKSSTLVPVDKFKLMTVHSESDRQQTCADNLKINDAGPSTKKAKVMEDVANEYIETDVHETTINTSMNSQLIAELSKLAKTYRSLGDIYRSRNYVSAVSVIQKYPKQIESYEEALAISGITQRMAAKIGEILETGSLKKSLELTDNEKVKVVELFTQIWGVGPATADSWFHQGYRTLDDVKNKCTLNKMQQAGVKYFDDFQKPIPRSEVEEISTKVKEAALCIDPTLKLEICGSYRRGKSLCGDIDLVVFEQKEEHSHLMEKLLKSLTDTGFISNEFMSLEAAKHHKFLGICKLAEKDAVFRRLDIFIAPLKEYAPAVIHYTGSANFNVALRQHAIKQGKHLSENGLFDNVVKQGNNIVSCTALPTPTEESVFQLLGLPYRNPEERETRVI